MKKIIIIISIISMFFWFIFDTFALNAPSNLKMVSSTDNSVKLSWDKVDKAFMYSVYYSKVPWTEKTYDNQTDYLEESTVEIKNLDAGTYYFSVVALNDLWEESTFWKELSLDIKWGNKTLTTSTGSAWIETSTTETTSTKNMKVETINNSGGIELNSASQTAEITNNTGTWLELLSAAESTENLPKTGTEHILLLLASMILWLWFFIFRTKRS
jgi:hypothetical protein